MSETTGIIPEKPSNTTPSLLLEDVFFAPLFQALQAPGITRGCAAVDDASFAALAVLRVLENSKTGRDFIQIHGIPNIPGLTRSNYFDGLASPRRLQMFIAMERELQRQQLPTLRAHGYRHAGPHLRLAGSGGRLYFRFMIDIAAHPIRHLASADPAIHPYRHT